MDETVDTMQMGNALDDAELAPEQPETGDSLSTLNDEAPVEQTQQQDAPPAKEPGWIKGRIDKAVTKALREQEDRLRAEYDAKLAPVFESMLERQAQELVREGEFKSIERAKEYVRMKQGMLAAEPAPTEQKKSGATDDPVARARADVLSRQADKIKANRGIDVMQAFNSDQTIQQKVLSGEWDFYDVAEAMGGNRRQPPSPVRSPNGVGVKTYDIMNMSEEQFKRLQANLSSGRKYDMRK